MNQAIKRFESTPGLDLGAFAVSRSLRMTDDNRDAIARAIYGPEAIRTTGQTTATAAIIRVEYSNCFAHETEYLYVSLPNGGDLYAPKPRDLAAALGVPVPGRYQYGFYDETERMAIEVYNVSVLAGMVAA